MFKERIKKIYSFRHALWDMAVVQFRAKYAGSKLGIWWAVITPLLLALSINFVFNVAFKIAMANYTFFVLVGIMPWFFFTNALTEATNSFAAGSSILKQTLSPPEFIPLSCILANLLNFLVGIAFLLPLLAGLNFNAIKLLPFLALIILLNFLFIAGLGIFFSSLNVFFRDLSHFLSIGFMVWFWITPVFYPLDAIPLSFRWVCILNPMTHYIVLYQDVLFYAQAPSWLAILNALSLAVLSVVIGYVFFLRKESSLLKRI